MIDDLRLFYSTDIDLCSDVTLRRIILRPNVLESSLHSLPSSCEVTRSICASSQPFLLLMIIDSITTMIKRPTQMIKRHLSSKLLALHNEIPWIRKIHTNRYTDIATAWLQNGASNKIEKLSNATFAKTNITISLSFIFVLFRATESL